VEEVVRFLDILAETDRELRFTSQPRLLIELAAVRLCRGAELAAAPAEAAAPRQRKAAAAAPPTGPREEAQAAPEPQEVVEQPAAPAAAGPVGLAEIRRRWDEVIVDLRKRKEGNVAAFLIESVPVALDDGTLVLEFGHQFHHDQMSEKRREVVAAGVKRLFGIDVRITCRMAPEGQASTGGDAAGGKAKKRRGSLDDVLSIFPGSEIEE
jgi:DNA polymerase-3 subunit gamma/tau